MYFRIFETFYGIKVYFWHTFLAELLIYFWYIVPFLDKGTIGIQKIFGKSFLNLQILRENGIKSLSSNDENPKDP